MKRLALAFLLLGACHRSDGPHLAPRRTMPMPEHAMEGVPDDFDDGNTGGFGAIETRAANGDPGRLKLDHVRVVAKQVGEYADVELEHHFTSEATVQMEGTFRMPLPDGAIVIGLRMQVGDKLVDGELVDSARAKKIYQEVVDSMADPALMEWEHGTTFKMRVFPIEPGKEKIVAVRFLAPLRHKGGALRFVQGSHVIDSDVTPRLDVEWNGSKVTKLDQPAAPVNAALREERDGAVYTIAHLRPDWSRVHGVTPVPKRWIVVVDTSRSALEERKLALDALRRVLGGLHAPFVVATSDLQTTVDPHGFQDPSQASIDAAVAFVNAVSPDGASDLSAMFEAAGAQQAGIVYLGDCEPTWGEIDPGKLAAQVKALGVPFYPLLLGDAADPELAHVLSAATGGRTVRARNADDVARFSRELSRKSKQLAHVSIERVAGSDVLPAGETTLVEGEDVVALVRTPTGPAPKALTLSSAEGDMKFAIAAIPAPMVARRFGAAVVRGLEQRSAPREEIVAASITNTVLSKVTSFLVLDSEEAYEKFDIERRATKANAEPAAEVTGLDPDSISADRIQPGDPEIEIDAPRDARRVFVVLPNGDMKVAEYEADANHGRGAWVVRFLVDAGVPEGTYQARVYIDFADGHRVERSVPYTVDTTAPELDVRVVPVPGGRTIDVRQRHHGKDIDLSRVEVVTPDGALVSLQQYKPGRYRGHYAGQAGTLHVVGVDQALNHTTLDVDVK